MNVSQTYNSIPTVISKRSEFSSCKLYLKLIHQFIVNSGAIFRSNSFNHQPHNRDNMFSKSTSVFQPTMAFSIVSHHLCRFRFSQIIKKLPQLYFVRVLILSGCIPSPPLFIFRRYFPDVAFVTFRKGIKVCTFF